MKYLLPVFAAVLLASAPLHAQQDPHVRHDMASMNHKAEDPATKALMDSHQKMMTDMNIKSTGNPDRDFAAMMVPHHEGAVNMAEVELKYGQDPELRKLAQDIIAAQKKEIAFMKAWLQKHK